MTDFDGKTAIKKLNEGLESESLPGDYAYAKLLLLYWAGLTAEHIAFRDEGRALGECFAAHFKFPVEEYAIPIELSQTSLQVQISQEVLLASKAAKKGGRSLLIVHYGGHGDNETDLKGRAIWASSSSPKEDEPLIYWYKIQESLEDSKADILLLLDCCFSAQAGRARKASSRIEVLTASAKSEETPLPGPKSFTTALIKVITKLLQQENSCTIEIVHAQLLKAEHDLYGTPVNIVLRPGYPARSLSLQRSGTPVVQDSSSARSLIRLLIRTPDLSEDSIDELIRWLRSDLPYNVSLEVESVVKATALLQDVLSSIPQQDGSFARSLKDPTIASMAGTWTETRRLLAQYKMQKAAKQDSSEESQQAISHEFLQQLGWQNSDMMDIMTTGALESLHLNTTALSEAFTDPINQSLGITEQLRLRQIITYPDSMSPDDLKHESLPSAAQGLIVWKETKHYGRYLGSGDITLIEWRISQLARLLNVDKSSKFRSLKCSGWYHKSAEREFVLEFQIPAVYKQPDEKFRVVSLKNAITDLLGPERPTLNQRLQMAFSIAKAVAHWHHVGWVHQGVSSHNVIFFTRDKCCVDFDMPFLQGFEFSRPSLGPSVGKYVEDIEHDVYRHPDRQGPARKGHTKVHDIYSLGVTLLEIGLWQDAPAIAGAKRRPGNSIVSSSEEGLTVNKMYANLQKAASYRLGHYAGEEYQQAVLACLSHGFQVPKTDEMEKQLQRSFQEKVLDKLGRGITVHP